MLSVGHGLTWEATARLLETTEKASAREADFIACLEAAGARRGIDVGAAKLGNESRRGPDI